MRDTVDFFIRPLIVIVLYTERIFILRTGLSHKMSHSLEKCCNYVGHLESKERLRIQPAQVFNFS